MSMERRALKQSSVHYSLSTDVWKSTISGDGVNKSSLIAIILIIPLHPNDALEWHSVTRKMLRIDERFVF